MSPVFGVWMIKPAAGCTVLPTAWKTFIPLPGYPMLMKDYTATAVMKAAEILGVTDRASLNEIRGRYRNLMKESHPDVADSDVSSSHRTAVELNRAYELLVGYCMNYRFTFRLEEIREGMEKTPAEYWMERYGDDPIWN